jgi:hypothetical protein
MNFFGCGVRPKKEKGGEKKICASFGALGSTGKPK